VAPSTFSTLIPKDIPVPFMIAVAAIIKGLRPCLSKKG
jgi:hypothetical protein